MTFYFSTNQGKLTRVESDVFIQDKISRLFPAVVALAVVLYATFVCLLFAFLDRGRGRGLEEAFLIGLGPANAAWRALSPRVLVFLAISNPASLNAFFPAFTTFSPLRIWPAAFRPACVAVRLTSFSTAFPIFELAAFAPTLAIPLKSGIRLLYSEVKMEPTPEPRLMYKL